MEYIYIETKPGKLNDFMDLLVNNGIEFDYIGYRTVMIHRMYFVYIGKVLYRDDLINSLASKIESL